MLSLSDPVLEIRDPIHGAIGVDSGERAVIDHQIVQRLRGIRQLGFSHLPFPGATHTRYTHSLGVMHLAGHAFDQCFRSLPFTSPARRRSLRRCLRLAALCHDLGHPPFSHAVEFAMPPLRTLEISAYTPSKVAHRLGRRAHHEDYTIALLMSETLARVIDREFGFTSRHVAALISPDVAAGDDFFFEGGRDLRGVLSQLISSEIDVDRMDYLVRDAYFTGARYGAVDVGWLLSNLSWQEPEGRPCLALHERAIYAFHDFMISRLHMFLMVYFHRKSVVYEEMLRRFMGDPGSGFSLPADVDAYRRTDDAALWSTLRQERSPWARRIVEFDPYRMAAEVHGQTGPADLGPAVAALRAQGIDVIRASTVGALFGKRRTDVPPLYIVGHALGGRSSLRPFSEADAALAQYQQQRTIDRLYVAAENLPRTREILSRST